MCCLADWSLYTTCGAHHYTLEYGTVPSSLIKLLIYDRYTWLNLIGLKFCVPTYIIYIKLWGHSKEKEKESVHYNCNLLQLAQDLPLLLWFFLFWIFHVKICVHLLSIFLYFLYRQKRSTVRSCTYPIICSWSLRQQFGADCGKMKIKPLRQSMVNIRSEGLAPLLVYM